MRRHLILLVFSFALRAGSAQISDVARDAIVTVVLSDDVEKHVFFDYQYNSSDEAYQLKSGRYAFICPDTTFRKIYPTILDELPYSIKTDGLLNLKTIYSDSQRGIYVNGILAAGSLFTIFTKVEVNSDRAEIDFFTTSLFDRSTFKEHYVRVESTLAKKGAKWVIETCRLEKIAWRKVFEPTYLKPRGEN